MNINQLTKDLNKLKITQTGDWLESIPEPHRSLLANKSVVADKLDVDKHRWYETSICVLEFAGLYIGVRYCSAVFSESSSINDIEWVLVFMEMEAILEKSYIVKKELENE